MTLHSVRAPVTAAIAVNVIVAVSAQQTPLFRSGADVVVIDVAVQRRNAPVTGLTAADFELTDNGVRQQVDQVFFEVRPIDVTVLLNLAGGTESLFDQYRQDVNAIVPILRPIDQLRVIGFGTDVVQLSPMQPVSSLLDVEFKPRGATAPADAIAAALIRPAPADRRQLVVAFPDDRDNASVVDHRLLREVARRADAALHVVFPNETTPEMRKTLEPIAVLTGGRSRTQGYVARPKPAVFKDIFDEVRQSYAIAYRRMGVPQAGWHDLKITVLRRGDVTVRARAGYFARN